MCKNKKKKLLAALALTFALNVGATAFAATTSYSNPFIDVPQQHWAYGAVKELVNDGVLEGESNGKFSGDKALTRYEFAQIVARVMTKMEKADANDKALINKLAEEFYAELNSMGVRVSAVEAKTNTWISGETALLYAKDSPNSGNGYSSSKLAGNDQFNFRERVKINGAINEKMSFNARMTTGYINPEDSMSMTADLANISAKDSFGFDNVTVGRMPVTGLGYGLVSRTGGADGAYVTKKLGGIDVKGYVANINKYRYTSTDVTSGDSNMLGSLGLGVNLDENTQVNVGYYRANFPGVYVTTMNTSTGEYSKSRGYDFGVNTKVGGLNFKGEFLQSKLKGASNLDNHPSGWAIQFDTAKQNMPVFYPTANIVNPAEAGENAFMVGYRSVDAGAVPYGAGGFDATAVNDVVGNNTTDNVKALYLAYQNVIEKNVLLSLEYQNMKYKDQGLTGLSGDGLDKTYMAKLEFFY